MTSPHSEDSSVQDMGELLDSVEELQSLRRGNIVEGIVMEAAPGADGIFLNVGHKAEGHVPANEMKTLSDEEISQLKVGDSVLAMVIRSETYEGSAILSIDRAAGEIGWKNLQKALDSGERISGKIVEFNRGGAIVAAEGVRGFVPMSQLVTAPKDKVRGASKPDSDDQDAAENQQEEPPGVGRTIELKVLELNRTRNRAILSERQAVQEIRNERKAKLIGELREGEVRRGRVTGISAFGAFVDLGGADGLIHISELSWSTVTSPIAEIVQVVVLRWRRRLGGIGGQIRAGTEAPASARQHHGPHIVVRARFGERCRHRSAQWRAQGVQLLWPIQRQHGGVVVLLNLQDLLRHFVPLASNRMGGF